MKRIKILTLATVLMLLLVACSSGGETKTESKSNETTTTTASAGEAAPDFTLTDVNGKTHSLKDYEGKKIYVKFWASWCPICLAGLEELNTLQNTKKDFEVLTVVAPGYKNEKNTADFKKWFSGVEEAPDITVLLDEGGKIADQYGVRGYPTSAYISADGKVVQTLPGHASNEQIIEKFKEIK